jgi:hypothetical protein
MHVWSYGLAEYLRRSNEDTVCSDFIGRFILRIVRHIWPDCGNFIRIADIGCGPGSKAVQIAQRLSTRGLKTHWDLVDIDEHWREPLAENVHHAGKKNDVRFDLHCPLSAQSWVKSSLTAPHVAQFIHVPYDDDTEEMVFEVAMNLIARRSLVLISTEDPRSDLNLIRNKFVKLGYQNLPMARGNSLAMRFRKGGFVVKQYTLGKQYLDIGSACRNNGDGWLWDLIFGTKHNISDEPRFLEVLNEFYARGHIRSLDSSILSVPDSLLTVRQRA